MLRSSFERASVSLSIAHLDSFISGLSAIGPQVISGRIDEIARSCFQMVFQHVFERNCCLISFSALES